MGLPRNRVEEMLGLVSLTPEGVSRRVHDYSLGMRQRLGIATAVIGEPEIQMPARAHVAAVTLTMITIAREL